MLIKHKTGSRWYEISCATLLLITAGFKLHAALLSSAMIMKQPDPIFLVSNRLLMLGTSFFEILAAAILLLNFSQRINLRLIEWTGFCFLSYHVISWFVGTNVCPCLGRIVKISSWLDAHQNIFIWAIIFYMMSGSFLLLKRKNELERIS